MPGTGTTDYLDAIAFGTAAGGAAGAAETTSTLGTARLDIRVPPDQATISGLQISRLVELGIAISGYLKGGTRLKVLKTTANPFSGSESGFYINTAGTAYKVIDGVATSLAAGGGSGDMVLADVQTVTGAKTFNDATLKQNNAGATFAHTFASAATANRTATLPDATDTLAGIAATQTLTNKTITAAVLSGSFSGTYTLAGTPTITSPAISGPTFSGSLVGTYNIAGSPSLTVALAFGTDNTYSLGSSTSNRASTVYSVGHHSGTTAMTNTTTVATGASRAGFIFNDTNAATTDKVVSFQVGGVEKSYIGNASGSFYGAGTTFAFLNSSNDGLVTGSGFGQLFVSNAAQVAYSSNSLHPATGKDTLVQLGQTALRWSTVYGLAYNSQATAMTFTTTVATGASRAGFIFNDTNSATTDKIASFRDNNVEQFAVQSDGKMVFIAGNEQTTVGAAGGASALPATPTKYIKIVDSAGTTLIIPAYAAS